MQELLEELREEEEVDTTFRETPVAKKTNFRENYAESLFGDDGYEETKFALLARVEKETRCAPIADLAFYLNREAAALKLSEKLTKNYEEKSIKPSYLRAKIAFKDLYGHKKDPIVIRCRDGR